MILEAKCKINLGLDVLRRRADGYHDLETAMVPVCGLADRVEVTKIEVDRAEFGCYGIAIDCPAQDNLCMKAYRLMRERYGVGGVRIELEKRIPFGAGLGGGSSDATAVLKALDRLFDLRLCEDELVALAARLGSDTAFFVRDTPQLCTGRGERMTPLGLDLDGYWLAIVKPDAGVSTREAYRGVVPRVPERPLAERLQRPVGEWQGLVKNDFEPSVFAAHPEIGALKEALLRSGALYASMSGSGSAVFGLFDRQPAPEELPEGCFRHVERIRACEALLPTR